MGAEHPVRAEEVLSVITLDGCFSRGEQQFFSFGLSAGVDQSDQGLIALGLIGAEFTGPIACIPVFGV